MRVKSIVDGYFKLIIFAAIGAMAVLSGFFARALLLSPQEALLGYGAVILGAALLLWLLYGTYYELCDDYLLCRSGPFVAKIPYDSIRQLTLCESLSSSMAMSVRRIQILQQDGDNDTGITLISPAGRELFLTRLNSAVFIMSLPPKSFAL
jgi:hypothetical protein